MSLQHGTIPSMDIAVTVDDGVGIVDQHVSGWPIECSVPGMKVLLVWEDEVGRRHVSICPCIKELVWYCSGVTSAVPTTAAPSIIIEPPLCEQ